MSKKVVAVNAGPRKGWNTDILIKEALEGAKSADEKIEIEQFDLFRLEKYTGCISCFGCKKEKNKGHCIVKDGLKPVLDAIRKANGLIIGSPIYLSETTASFRALYERLIFQCLTYNREFPSCNEHPIPVLLIATCNAPASMYQSLMENYQQTFNRFIGPTETYLCGETLQIQDYDNTDWPWNHFDPQAKKQRHETVFPLERKEVYELGKGLAKEILSLHQMGIDGE